jgi:hypothetical protein
MTGSVPTAKADIFAVGIIFYEMLTLKHPFFRPTPEGIIFAIKDEEPE